MSHAIYMQLGEKDKITLNALISALRNFLGVLEDIDSAVSGDRNGSVRWEVVSLQKASPTTIGVLPHPKNELSSIAPLIEKELLDGLAMLSYSSERHQYYSDAALSKVQRLASQSKSLGKIKIYTDDNIRHSFIDATVFQNIRGLTGAKEESYGSVVGSLDAITVHRSNEFRVWDEYSGKAVTCKFPPHMEEDIKSFLRKRVLVHGLVYLNQTGQPTAVDVNGIELSSPVSNLPTIEEMSGLVEDFTDGVPLDTFLKDLRNG